MRALRVADRTVRLFGFAVFGLLVGMFLALHVPARAAISGDLALARSDRPGIRVLLVGNSFTSANGLAVLVHRLAAGDRGGRPVFAVAYTRAGGTLRQAARDRQLVSLLRSFRWDDVVLQEQSQLPSFPTGERARESDPYARELASRATADGARTILFMTWGYEYGDRRNFPGDTFGGMQARLVAGYSELAGVLGVPVAPVGLAWADALSRRPGLELWAGDGKHPARAGSYLAACVLYRELTRRDPRRSSFHGGLDGATATLLEDVAASY